MLKAVQENGDRVVFKMPMNIGNILFLYYEIKSRILIVHHIISNLLFYFTVVTFINFKTNIKVNIQSTLIVRGQ